MSGFVIYCCGEGGRVGWVTGWDFNQATGDICDVHLSLDHNSAVILNGRGCAKVGRFLRRSKVFGLPKIFSLSECQG